MNHCIMGWIFDLFSCSFLNGNFLSVPDVFQVPPIPGQQDSIDPLYYYSRTVERWTGKRSFCKVVASPGGMQNRNGLRELGM